MKKIAIGYLRVSGEQQGDNGYSLEAQAAQIEQFCRDNDIELQAQFMEVESGKSVTQRPIFKAVLQHLYADFADYVVVTNLDRFSRNLLDSEVLRYEMEQRGKKLISVQQKYITPVKEVDEEDEFELTAQRQRAFIDAEYERKKIYRRCFKGRQRKAERGGWYGHGVWYETDIIRGRPVVNKERARTIRLMVRLRKVRHSEGRKEGHPFSYQDIADYLNGNNKLLNSDGTKGRVFMPPGSRESEKRERRTAYVKQGLKWWKETVRKIIQSYDQRQADILKYADIQEIRRRA